MNNVPRIILVNLGGPTSLDAVKPFLFNLFNDRAIIQAPQPIRWLLAKLISVRRYKKAQEIYQQLGGKSPLLSNTQQQADALHQSLKNKNVSAKIHVAMRYWHPLLADVLDDIMDSDPAPIMILPLYPQFSTTTTGSALELVRRKTKARQFGLGTAPSVTAPCCYPVLPGFINANVALIQETLRLVSPKDIAKIRFLFSAHGLPQRIVDQGDPYPIHVQQTAESIIDSLKAQRPDWPNLDWKICFQSRVGPVTWTKPYTDEAIIESGHMGKDVVIIPLSFVSEHSETLVELDHEFKALAYQSGVQNFWRVPTVGCHPDFIDGLASWVIEHLPRPGQNTIELICPTQGGCTLACGSCRVKQSTMGES